MFLFILFFIFMLLIVFVDKKEKILNSVVYPFENLFEFLFELFVE